jgi:hypothetical protein
VNKKVLEEFADIAVNASAWCRIAIEGWLCQGSGVEIEPSSGKDVVLCQDSHVKDLFTHSHPDPRVANLAAEDATGKILHQKAPMLFNGYPGGLLVTILNPIYTPSICGYITPFLPIRLTTYQSSIVR